MRRDLFVGIVCLAAWVACADQQVFRVQGHAVLQEDPESASAHAKTLYPAAIGSARYQPGPKKKLLVRAHVQEPYRKQTLEWQTRFVHQIDGANSLLRGDLEAELEIVEVKTWPASSDE